MFLKNYTSNVPVSQTIHRIEQVLIRCGVSGITKNYGPNGEVSALVFEIQFDPKMPPARIRLPADREAAWTALWLDYVNGDKLTSDGNQLAWNPRKKKTKADFREQAERTAWKLVQDWVEVQLSMIQMKQADFLQVFLPYVWDEQRQRTFYQTIKEANYKGLLAETNP